MLDAWMEASFCNFRRLHTTCELPQFGGGFFIWQTTKNCEKKFQFVWMTIYWRFRCIHYFLPSVRGGVTFFRASGNIKNGGEI